MKEIYLDNAAAAPIDPEVQREVVRAMKIYGNPSSYNDSGREAARELSRVRIKVARFLGAHSNEIIFTSSGTESNNLAIQGTVRQLLVLKPHIITMQIEHPSVLEPIKLLAREGVEVSYLPVNKEGFVDLKEFQNSLRKETALVSIMYANNEIGTIESINKIGKIIKEFNKKLEIDKTRRVLFHVDACQAAGYLNMNVNNLQADLVTFNGSKLGGPRGIGVLYIRHDVALTPCVLGGGQERGMRAGTENLSAILGLAKAIELIDTKESARVMKLRDYFIGKIKKIDSEIRLNGPTGKERLANNINISIPGLDSENLLLELDKYGIHAGSGSACTSHSVEPSHVLKAIGVNKKHLLGVLRFSMGKQTTKKDLDYVLRVLPKVISDLKKRYENN
ncbi:MAG: hypothetical protein A2915_04430 [Candidatus Yanofskybacteria bacterium RIFCSPLOWO2_01_FULL_41_34]|uniref:Aminotransferase class V domain-containing protein n=1 Tax=Candidatus Yanofskybacteria bacterium RIFCSPHIGHO2_01_FULL_41_26 TaxID=1802661 RepID=A0A1F8EEB9_9BACT|nr:MAG: hypothetical protein A2649_03530 [Candidatus Yanofskybacteria bacterium RIFCSPHIGHO2_01_FULL_41_26]OGN21645.1 MAG: hypothetical protein A2915_04430 [Candidatus Yanofskybacteria bacterium RIFCSPLOWO2_01_FULL_41_34]